MAEPDAGDAPHTTNGAMMRHGYEPLRITELTRRCREALGALDAVSSDDPAAAEAMTALAGLRSVVADAFIPAVTAIAVTDPLGAASAPAGADWYDEWLRTLVVTDYTHMNDDELFAELERLEDDLPYDHEFQPDMNHPFWAEFEQLSIELAIRAETDGSFGDRLADEAVDTFLIPFALEFATFDPAVAAGMLLTVSEWPPWSIDLHANFRTVAAQTIIDFLSGFPAVALEALTHPDADRGDDVTVLEDLLRWPGLDPKVVTAFLDAAMSAPFDRPELLPTAGTVLQRLVHAANGMGFPGGFAAELSPTLAKIFVQYLPLFITSLDDRGDVHLKGFDFRDIDVELGSYGDVIDLVGALLRDRVSLEILLGVIPTLSVLGHDEDGPLGVSLDDVADYLWVLQTASENEQLEEALDSARTTARAELAIEMIFGAIDVIAYVAGPLKGGAATVMLSTIKNGAQLFADWAIDTTELDLDQVATVASLLMAYGVSVAVVRDRDSEDADEDERLQLAEDIIDRVEDALGDGRSIDEVAGLLDDLRRVVADIDGETSDILDDDRVAPRRYDVDADVDTER